MGRVSLTSLPNKKEVLEKLSLTLDSSETTEEQEAIILQQSGSPIPSSSSSTISLNLTQYHFSYLSNELSCNALSLQLLLLDINLLVEKHNWNNNYLMDEILIELNKL